MICQLTRTVRVNITTTTVTMTRFTVHVVYRFFFFLVFFSNILNRKNHYPMLNGHLVLIVYRRRGNIARRGRTINYERGTPKLFTIRNDNNSNNIVIYMYYNDDIIIIILKLTGEARTVPRKWLIIYGFFFFSSPHSSDEQW